MVENQPVPKSIRGDVKILKLQDNIEGIKESRKEEVDEFKEFITSIQQKGISIKGCSQSNLYNIYRHIYSDNDNSPSYSYNQFTEKLIISGKIEMAFKYALKSGEIKILNKPILFSNINIKPTTVTNQDFLTKLKEDLYVWHKNLTSGITLVKEGDKQVMQPKIDKNRTCYQLLAYRELSFEKFFPEKYYTVYGIAYNPENKNDRLLLSFSSSQQLIYRIKHNKTQELLKSNNIENINDYFIQDELFSYISPLNIMQLIEAKEDDRETAESYNKKIKKLNLYNILKIRKPDECLPYKPGLVFLKLPTIEPKTFKFPKLEENK